MEPREPQYKREQNLHSETEVFHYLYEIHHVMIDHLFGSHQLVGTYADRIVSEVYARGETVLFVTFFDDDGDTCHQIFDLHEAVRIGIRRLREKEVHDQIAQERRSQIRLVEPKDDNEDTSDEEWGCYS